MPSASVRDRVVLCGRYRCPGGWSWSLSSKSGALYSGSVCPLDRLVLGRVLIHVPNRVCCEGGYWIATEIPQDFPHPRARARTETGPKGALRIFDVETDGSDDLCCGFCEFIVVGRCAFGRAWTGRPRPRACFVYCALAMPLSTPAAGCASHLI